MAREARTSKTSPAASPDFQALFEAAPGLYLVLTPDFTIVAVSDAYAKATMTRREDILGRGLFEVFPDNPDDPTTEGVRNLRASLGRVVQHCVTDAMPVQKYDIRKPESEGGEFEVRYWSPVNSPVLDTQGDLKYIIHCVVDVTEFMNMKLAGAEQQQLTREARQQIEMMESQVFLRTQQVAEASRQLKEANAESRLAAEEARAARSFADSILENLPIMVFVKDARHLRFVRFNKAGEELLGYSREELIGKNDYDFFPKDEADFFTAKDRAVLENGELLDIAEEPIRTKPRGNRILHTKKIPIFDAAGVPVYLLGISEDITEKKLVDEQVKQLNQSLLQHATQLESANRELEAFSYSVSHDLRAPLRSLDGFSRALIEDYEHALDARAKDYLQRICAAAQRMGQLIDDILQLSRLTRQVMSSDNVDLTAMASGIVAELRKGSPDRDVAVTIEPAMASRGDSRLLHVALENLLGNAWKYTARKPVSHIHFGVKTDEPTPVFYVRDDGAGFDMQYAGRLFGAFQRLHPVEEFDGTGIGLATVQRIVHRHGGQVWAEAEAGRGATFYFTLSPIGVGGESHEGKSDTAGGRQSGRRGTDAAGAQEEQHLERNHSGT